MWLSHGPESVPEQDNEIACQVIWFENSSHLWTGVWANKPRVCQDSFFFKLLCSLHLPQPDMSDSVFSTEQKTERAQVPAVASAPLQILKHFSVAQNSEKSTVAQKKQDILSASPLMGAAVAESYSTCSSKGVQNRSLNLGSIWGALWPWPWYITFLRLSFPICKV